MSLPWKGIFTSKGHGAGLRERAKNFQNQTNTILSGPNASDLGGASLSSENVQPKALPNSSSNDWLDLLTGDGTDLNPFANPVKEHYDDQAVSESCPSLGVDPSDNGTKQYINCLKSLTGPQMV